MFESEERIVRKIKDFIKSNKSVLFEREMMLRNERILLLTDYLVMVDSGKINPNNAYVDIDIVRASSKAEFYYPFLYSCNYFLDVYLSKLGFDYRLIIVPAAGLKYVAFAEVYENYLSIEIVNLDTAVDNTNLRTIVFEVVGDKIISGDRELTWLEYEKIDQMFKSQRLLAGYTTDEARNILYDYYDKGNKSLAKEAVRITMDYDRIFNPYRVCYNMKTWKEVNCWSVKLV